ncbi:ABC transporter ATP-binding protein [uncultured Eubacterium sp.]|uniref:ABC transporter ATP-binding protein n=1 Tax=uncultured Eubacterium sp. TaxID=165185 RepID=UPI0032662425
MKKQSSLSKLFVYAGNFKYLSILSWVLSVLSAWIALVPFYYIWKIMQEILNVAPNYAAAQNLSDYGWKAVGFAVLSMFIYICALMCSHIAAFRVQSNIRLGLMKHIVTLPMGFMDKEGSGKIRKIVNESSAATETYLAHQLPDKAGAIATPVGLLVLLLIFDWRLGLLSLVPVVFAFAIMGTMTGENMKNKMNEYQKALDEMSSEAVEYVRGIPVVKTFGQSFFSFKRFKLAIDKYEKWTIEYTKELRVPMTFYTMIINAVFAVLIAATFWFSNGASDNKFLLNLIFYIIVTPIITVTLSKIMYQSENELIVEEAMSRIESILDRKALPEGNENKKVEDYSIKFDNVSFRYADATKDALHNINLKINEGEHIAFVGPSGGGKTTLASLVARFFDTTKGTITVGNVDVKDIPSEQLNDMVSFVFQDSKLLKTSIFENIRMGKKEASREEVMEALKNAQCQDIIDKMPNGIDTVIGTKGTYVSGGEAQRLSIARAMLKNAPILILDEATAFADPDNETKVQEAFSKLSKGKTVIMIAHRLSSIVDADKCYVLKDGEIVESGKHEELLKTNGIYAHMWQEYNKSVDWKVGA